MATEIVRETDAIDSFGDITVNVEVRVGERMIRLDEAASLDAGTTMSLDKTAGASLELVIGNVRFGACEVTAVDGRMAVRITELTL